MKAKILLCILALASIEACKKGDEDPFFTLNSRKARISGEWKFSSSTKTSTNIDNLGDESSSSEIGTDKLITNHSENSYYVSESSSDIVEYSFTINKDGTWERVFDAFVVYARDYPDNLELTEGHRRTVESGTWCFLYKTKGEYKSKERVMFNILESSVIFDESKTTTTYDDPSIPTTLEITSPADYTYSYDGSVDYFTYDIVMLKSKKMKWSLVTNISSMSHYDTYTNGYEYVGSEEIVWVSK